MNIQITLDFELDIPDAEKLMYLAQAYALRHFLDQQIYNSRTVAEFRDLIASFKSVDMIVRD